MIDRKNLPIQLTDRALVSSSEGHCSLVTRGINALRNIDNDVIYRQARKRYNESTDNGTMSWWGCEERKEPMVTVFEVFQKLAEKGYGKAFFPLSTIYNGEQSIEGCSEKAQYFHKLAFDWLHGNEHLNDPEIWCDLGVLYIAENHEISARWFQKGADVEDASSMWMLSGAYEFGAGVEQDWVKSRYWQVKAAMAGHAKAQHGLEAQHHHGDLDIDDEKVFDWYVWSAEKGHLWAQECLGDIQPNGDEIKPTLTIMAYTHGRWLWSHDMASISLPNTIISKANKWLKKYAYFCDHPDDSLLLAEFNPEGMNLARQVQQYLNISVEVFYTSRHPDQKVTKGETQKVIIELLTKVHANEDYLKAEVHTPLSLLDFIMENCEESGATVEVNIDHYQTIINMDDKEMDYLIREVIFSEANYINDTAKWKTEDELLDRLVSILKLVLCGMMYFSETGQQSFAKPSYMPTELEKHKLHSRAVSERDRILEILWKILKSQTTE